MSPEDEKELLELLEEKRKRKAFFEILKRPYVCIPSFIFVVMMVEDPEQTIAKVLKHITQVIKDIF